MNVVTIPSNVADEIEYLRKRRVDNETILVSLTKGEFTLPVASKLRAIPFDTLLSALVNGYVREKTEAERHAELRRIFEVNGKDHDIGDHDLDCYSAGIIYGIDVTLKLLKITIVGINENQTEVSANV